jgi:signal transduction histidine kinase
MLYLVSLTVVPIFNIDKHPFALLCAYTCNQAKQFLEGYELQFLRAIGVVILSAVLKKRMVLADKAKSNFISNISHELRTPLHGILAAAELLQDTQLDVNQTSFLSTVQACGNSLIETVNHVLDFTKLSGNTKASIENVIKPGSVDLAHLVEETVEGCWIGQRARAQQGQSEIGSFYSPPSPSGLGDPATKEQVADRPYVETVIDIGFREKGWQVRCEKGGIRRVLMNLIGNSLKFTRDGYIQVTLRELPHTPGSRSIPVEMAVIDTGKGISRDFLKDQLFHPFSQENPLQTGTGLGLAIVNSIVRSESVNGKVDVWSSEGLGTEIKISLNVDLETGEISDEADPHGSSVDQALPWNEGAMFGKEMTVSMANFRLEHRGSKLNQELVASYLQWWAFELLPDDSEELGEVIIADEEGPLLRQLLERNDTSRAVLILSTSRVPRPSSAMSAYQKAGGFVQMVFKPVGPERLQAALRAGVKALTRSTPSQETTRSVRSDYFSPPLSPHRPRSPSSEISWRSSRPEYQRQGGSIAGSVTGSIAESITDSIDEAIRPSVTRESTMSTIGSPVSELPIHFNPMARRLNGIKDEGAPGLLRRRSEEDRPLRRPLQRPGMTPRSTTFNDVRPSIHSIVGRIRGSESGDDFPSVPGSPNSTVSTVSLADGGVMLKKAAAPTEVILEHRKPRILLVDDNHINLQLLSAYLKKRVCRRAFIQRVSTNLFVIGY